ncbi:MAG: hypothetical protein Q7O66_17445 [Dehalococcoidia bacterium]|nr:hypothetical protein [Dehalococcoidia bacterium]
MSLPFTKRETVWTDQAATATAILDDQLTRMCPTKVIEITTTGFSGTLDIKGRILPSTTADNVSYFRIGQGAGQSPSNAQISWTTDTARYRYMVTEPYMDMSLVMTRSAGSVSVNVGGWGFVVDGGSKVIASIAAGDNNIGNVDIVTLPAGNLGQQAVAASLSTTQAPGAAVAHASKTTNAATAVALAASTACRSVIVSAKDANTGYVYIGGATVSSASYGKRLLAGQSVSLAIANLALAYIDVSVNGEGVDILYVT